MRSRKITLYEKKIIEASMKYKPSQSKKRNQSRVINSIDIFST